jgi:hypothetical protein
MAGSATVTAAEAEEGEREPEVSDEQTLGFASMYAFADSRDILQEAVEEAASGLGTRQGQCGAGEPGSSLRCSVRAGNGRNGSTSHRPAGVLGGGGGMAVLEMEAAEGQAAMMMMDGDNIDGEGESVGGGEMQEGGIDNHMAAQQGGGSAGSDLLVVALRDAAAEQLASESSGYHRQ